MGKVFYTDKVHSLQLLCILVMEQWGLGFFPIYLQSTISGPFLWNFCIQNLAGLKSLFLSLGVETNAVTIFYP